MSNHPKLSIKVYGESDAQLEFPFPESAPVIIQDNRSAMNLIERAKQEKDKIFLVHKQLWAMFKKLMISQPGFPENIQLSA